jgi:hypothetical protein
MLRSLKRDTAIEFYSWDYCWCDCFSSTLGSLDILLRGPR